MTPRTDPRDAGLRAAGVRVGPRLLGVADLVRPGSRVADIGADHGGLARWLLTSGRAEFCVATEPARGRRVHPASEGPAVEGLDLRWGQGLDPIELEDRIDTLTLCGMGTRTITSILGSRRREALAPAHLVLQPQSDWSGLRGWIWDRDWSISGERLIQDRQRFYLALSVEVGPADDVPAPPSDPGERSFQALAGPRLLERPPEAMGRFWEKRSAVARREIDRAREPRQREHAERELFEARQVLERIGRDDLL